MDRKKVTGRTDQGTKEFPGDEAYKKLFAKMLEEDKEKEKKKLEKSTKKKEKEEEKEKKSIQQAIKKNYQSIQRLDGSFKKAIARISKIEKTVGKQQKKTTKIISILKTQQSNIGEKLPGNTGNELQKSLVETNKVLVDILKQMQLQSALEDKERRKLKQKEQIKKSKKRLSAKESELEKSSKKIIKETKEKTEAPIKGIFSSIFDGILQFITLLGAGIATNAAFEWLKDEENRKKLQKFFNILTQNWQLLAKIFGTLVIANLATKLAGALLKLKSIFAIFTNPLFIAGIGVVLAASMQGLGEQEQATIKDLEDMGGITPENRKKLIQKDKQEIENISYDTGGILGRVTLDPGKLDNLRHKIRFLETGRYDYGGKTLSFDFGLSNFNYNMGSKFNFDTGKLESLSGDGKSPGFDFGGERAMGGPVAKGQSYLVGEKGPELFTPNINGSIVNNMRTEKIVQTLSSDMGEGSINMINLPPITNQMPMPEVQVPSGQATDVPEISSINIADPYRQLSPMLYGITV